MNIIIRCLSYINSRQLEVMRWGAMILVLAIAVIVAAGVFYRYVLNDSLSWSEELAKYALLWLVFLGSPIALRLGGHPNIEIVISRFPDLIVGWVKTLVYLAVFIFCGYLAFKSHAFAWNGRTQVAIAIGDVSMYWFFLSIPVGMGSMALVSLQQFLEELFALITRNRFEDDAFLKHHKSIIDEF